MQHAHSAPLPVPPPAGAHSIHCPYCDGSGEVVTGQSRDGAVHDKPCPNCKAAGTLLAPWPLGESCGHCHGWGWAGGIEGRCRTCCGFGKTPASPEVCDVVARRMTRREYEDTRNVAFARLADANLLRHADPDEAKKLAAFARQLLAAIAAPVDAVEAARNKKLLRLGAALELAAKAKVLRDTARQVARRAAA
jgi:hypothetical protein